MAVKSERKPMKFTVAEAAAPLPAPAAPAASIARADGVERQQVGARVTKATYRQLKARAALTGAPVQDLVEQAIIDFLAKSV
jgi:hypothetical protein